MPSRLAQQHRAVAADYAALAEAWNSTNGLRSGDRVAGPLELAPAAPRRGDPWQLENVLRSSFKCLAPWSVGSHYNVPGPGQFGHGRDCYFKG